MTREVYVFFWERELYEGPVYSEEELQSAWQMVWDHFHRKPAWPELPTFSEWSSTRNPERQLDLVKKFNRLQVIVKLVNIELTPEDPCYEGGAWHIEDINVSPHHPCV